MKSDEIPIRRTDVKKDFKRIPERASFSDPETHFYLPSAPVTEDWRDVHYGEPTGLVVCLSCWRSDPNVDKIDHECWCPQRHVHSWFWQGRECDSSLQESVPEL